MARSTRSAATRPRSSARSGRRASRARRCMLPVKIEQTGDELTVTVPAAKDEKGQAEVWLCPITRSVPVSIGRGENSGHTITYTNVVRRWIKLGDWTGKAETFSVPMKDVQTGRHRFRRRDGAERRCQRAQADARRGADLAAVSCPSRLQRSTSWRMRCIACRDTRRSFPNRIKKGPAMKPALDIGGLNRTRNNRPGLSKPRGAGGLRNPVLFETGPEVTQLSPSYPSAWQRTCPKLGSNMISLTNP